MTIVSPVIRITHLPWSEMGRPSLCFMMVHFWQNHLTKNSIASHVIPVSIRIIFRIKKRLPRFNVRTATPKIFRSIRFIRPLSLQPAIEAVCARPVMANTMWSLQRWRVRNSVNRILLMPAVRAIYKRKRSSSLQYMDMNLSRTIRMLPIASSVIPY